MHLDNPSTRVEAAFRRIERERMAGLPMLNPALAVEAVDFEIHDGRWLGVLVTPWSMSLMLLPASETGWTAAPEGRHLMMCYPAGELAFLGGAEVEIGAYLSCSLFVSMAQFPDQESARLTARAARIALLAPPQVAEAPASPSRRGFLTAGIDSGKRHA
jgi:[NiFe] hydrogenase assembly HybE family chaperone